MLKICKSSVGKSTEVQALFASGAAPRAMKFKRLLLENLPDGAFFLEKYMSKTLKMRTASAKLIRSDDTASKSF